ncbi:MAG: hypothetical protein LWX83_08440, partial [Anaerolineae bacterium]|nr:hypothetical protein [Anaerolineae bacterium]
SFIIMNWIGHVSNWAISAFLMAGAVNLSAMVLSVKAFGLKFTAYWALFVAMAIIIFTFTMVLIFG